MPKCNYKKPTSDWKCSLEALTGEDYCYWHKEDVKKKPNEVQIRDLKEKIIYDVYLQEANLKYANLQKAKLIEANLSRANLKYANLFEANLCIANLQGAKLSSANLQKATLSWANLQDAELSCAKFEKSDLREANLKKAKMGGANLQEVFLYRANLQETDLAIAQLQKANLNEAKLQGADLRNSNLQDADLSGAKLHKAILFGTNFQSADLNGADLQGVNLRNANLKDAILIEANLHESDLEGADLERANLEKANLQGASLINANFQGAKLFNANLSAADLSMTDFRGADLCNVSLNTANLQWANLQDAKLIGTTLVGANLESTRFDSQTTLDGAILIGANLFHSYFDESKSFRNATFFQKIEHDKEINEIMGDALNIHFIQFERFKQYTSKIFSILFFYNSKVREKMQHFSIPLRFPTRKRPYLLDFKALLAESPRIAEDIRHNEYIRYTSNSHGIVFFDKKSGCIIKNPEKGRWFKDLTRVEGLTDMILEGGEIKSKYLYDGSSFSFYEASYEIYNNLYNFYIANGHLDQAAYVHYRREEAHRKLRWVKGGNSRLRSIFDLLYMRSLAGYGDKISHSIASSSIIVMVFAFLFKFSKGVTKNVNGLPVTPDWLDHIYYSIITFLTVGDSNIQPNLAIGHLPQILVATESGLGVMMIALIIFVITYQVSR